MPRTYPLDAQTEAQRQQIRDDAKYMALTGAAESDRAKAAVTDMLQRLGLIDGRPSTIAKRQSAAGAMLYDLIVAQRLGVWGKRSLNNNDLTGIPGGRTAFTALHQRLATSGLVDYMPGYSDSSGFARIGRPACFRGTPALFDILTAHGIVPDNVTDHFSAGRVAIPQVAALVEKRTASKGSGLSRQSGKPMDIDFSADAQAAANRDRVQAINNFLGLAEIEGLAFGGLRRIFNNGDKPGFSWQWGGRLYSLPGADAYDRWKGKKAARIGLIRIQGEPSTEVDIAASHLTVIYALAGQSIDPTSDPYAVPGYDRDSVKNWVRDAIGRGDAEGRKGQKRLRQAILERHPVLETMLGGPDGVSWADCQFHESEILLSAIETLRDVHQVPSLPVHDSLVVPASKADLTRDVLREAFRSYFVDRLETTSDITPLLH